MVRLKNPLMSVEAHGKLAGFLTFATNAWGQYAKFSPTQRDPRTKAQTKVRHAYGQVATLWRAMTDEEKAAYHEQAMINRRTDYNQFFHEVWPLLYLFWNTSVLRVAALNRAHLGRSIM